MGIRVLCGGPGLGLIRGKQGVNRDIQGLGEVVDNGG